MRGASEFGAQALHAYSNGYLFPGRPAVEKGGTVKRNILLPITLYSVVLLTLAVAPLQDQKGQWFWSTINHRTDVVVRAAFEQGYPTKPVRIIEPYGAGGGVDVLARPVARKLSELWGQPVTVENHPGRGATAAPALVAKSQADGYTLLVNSSAQAYSAAFRKDLPYDPLKDFIPVAPLTSQPYVLVVNGSAGISDLKQLRQRAEAKPGQVKFGFAGIGTGSHLAVLKFNVEAHIKSVGVPPGSTEGIAEVVSHTVAGDTTYMIAPIPMALPHIREGRLRALGVTGMRRSPLLPEVPTIAEGGVRGFNFPIWYGIWAPRGTPAQVVDELAQGITNALEAHDLREWFTSHGAEPMHMKQAEFTRFVRRESKSAAEIIKAAGSR
jgi:tripartite-type tricarboxylate transporter receptor subunit TctC